ncbi:MAG TPA: hypothetical protein VM529_24960 [Gemmata sp.]|jgi:hypothetical protein|nr:hypothetical protein [Gemmata sp.]
MSPKTGVVAQVTFVLTADGNVRCGVQGAVTRATFNMVVETGRQDMLALFAEKERQAAEASPVGIAPPGFDQALKQ